MKDEIKDLVSKTLVVTPSGALSPGLLSASAVAVGITAGPLGGLAVALGHTAFELPYVFVLSKTLGRITNRLEKYKKLMALVVFAFVLFFTYGLISGPASLPAVNVSNAFVAGFVFTAFNFYFLLWWATVGLPLLELSADDRKKFGIMYLSHVWMDYVWLALLAALGKAISMIGGLAYLNYALALMLLVFGFDVLSKAFAGKGILS